MHDWANHAWCSSLYYIASITQRSTLVSMSSRHELQKHYEVFYMRFIFIFQLLSLLRILNVQLNYLFCLKSTLSASTKSYSQFSLYCIFVLINIFLWFTWYFIRFQCTYRKLYGRHLCVLSSSGICERLLFFIITNLTWFFRYFFYYVKIIVKCLCTSSFNRKWIEFCVKKKSLSTCS